jgi:anaerobic selenocysteine-containing dehydrogenase
LEAYVEGNRIVRAKEDPTNPESSGHACRKGRNIAFFEHNADRLHYPLKRIGEDEFERISWEQALDEISTKMKEIVGTYGPRTLASTNLGQFIGQIGGLFGVYLLALQGAKYRFSNLAAELTGLFWSSGILYGHQGYTMEPNTESEEGEMLIADGWNGYVSNNYVTGKRVCSKYARDPHKILVVIDPRKSETAQIADIHLAIRPGTDTIFWRAVGALLIQEKWYNQAYVDEHVADFEAILPWYEGVDVREYCAFCALDYEDVRSFTKLLATKRTGIHYDLGVICGRNSTMTTHLGNIAMALTGNLLVPGGNTYGGSVLGRMANTPTKDPDNFRMMETGIPAINGLHPTACFAEEVLNDRPDHIRILINGCQNSMNSYVDTPALEEALRSLDLMVTVDCQMSETARLSHYILPMQTAYEAWECNELMDTFPSIYTKLRQPLVEPEPEVWNACDIYLALTDKMGLIPPIPQHLYDAAQGSRLDYQAALLSYLSENPKMAMFWPHIIAKTLGPVLGSTAKAAYWGAILFADDFKKEAYARKGYEDGPNRTEEIFQQALRHPGGSIVGEISYEQLFASLQTEDKKIHLYADELEPWVYDITPEKEAVAMTHPEFPLILFSGSHAEVNANGVLRNQPGWITGKKQPQPLSVHPENAAQLGIEQDGDLVRLYTDKGHQDFPARITYEIRKGTVMAPHGFGMRYDGTVNGHNLNMLTNCKNRDPFAGTPYLRYVPCRVERLSQDEEVAV